MVLAELAATPGQLELVRRVPAALMGHLPHAMVASVAAAVLAEQELVVELEEPEEQELVVEPAVVWAWRRLVEPAELVAQEGLALMRVDYQMGQPEEMPGMVESEALAARPARWVQMWPHWLVGMADPEEMPEAQAQVLRVRLA